MSRSREHVGTDIGAGVCVIDVDSDPGEGPRLHRHPYEEVILIHDGEATFTLGDEQVIGRAGDLLVVPAGTPHKFVNTGTERLRQVDVHVSPEFVTEWLE